MKQYNLKELCEYAQISTALMKQYQMKFKLGKGVKKGKRTYYDQSIADKYKLIKAKRAIGMSYHQIKYDNSFYSVFAEKKAIRNTLQLIMFLEKNQIQLLNSKSNQMLC